MNDAPADPTTGPAVLVVDDNVDACQALTMLLRAHGFRVEYARDASTTLSTARAMAPDAILMDLNLPDGHGVDLLQRLHGEPWASGCLFIAVTGDETAGEHANRAGFFHVMMKPVEFEQLLECLAPLGV